MHFFSKSWCELEWTEWIPFQNISAFKNLPGKQGVYRVRSLFADELFYIGQSGRGVRGRLRNLRRHTVDYPDGPDKMPFNDPHTAAPSLWVWSKEEGHEYECSAASFSVLEDKQEDKRYRMALECYLLWSYRVEKGTSTRCNFGRFHSRYKKSLGAGRIPKDKVEERELRRGRRLLDSEPDNISAGSSCPPLLPVSEPNQKNWMSLVWSDFFPLKNEYLHHIPAVAGVYKVFDTCSGELLYIGETFDLSTRLSNHCGDPWGNTKPVFAFSQLPYVTLEYQLLEIENDLIGGYYQLTKRPPRFQFAKMKLAERSNLPEEEEQ